PHHDVGLLGDNGEPLRGFVRPKVNHDGKVYEYEVGYDIEAGNLTTIPHEIRNYFIHYNVYSVDTKLIYTRTGIEM
ncbi:MAG: hypothetical protein MUE99_07585, partial [Chitinophagaceae bacterium]|nr:hypothetical protein [Chitinophagaceae bacterium]